MIQPGPHMVERENQLPQVHHENKNEKQNEQDLLGELGFFLFFFNLVELGLSSDWLMGTHSHTACMHKYVCMHKQMKCNKTIIIKEKEVI